MRRDLDSLREVTTRTFACVDTDWFTQDRQRRLVRVRDAFCFLGLEFGATAIELSGYFGDTDESSVRKAHRRVMKVAAEVPFYGKLVIAASREYRMRQVIRWRTWPDNPDVRAVEVDHAV